MGFHDQRKSALVIDDHGFRETLASHLAGEDYKVVTAASIDEASQCIRQHGMPTFILVDRFLEGEKVEDAGLHQLRQMTPTSSIVVYTNRDALSQAELYLLQDRGALRVLDKTRVGDLVSDIKVLTKEFDELLDLRSELETVTVERSKMISALLGTDVGVAVVDRAYHCWFANATLEQFVGGRCTGGLYWKQFFGLPETAGPSWGCGITDVLNSGRPAEMLRLVRYTNGNIRWMSVRMSPIQGLQTQKIVAVRKGVAEAADSILSNLQPLERLHTIAASLLHLGFGRTRIYETRVGGLLTPVAAAAQSDQPNVASSEYFSSIRLVTLNYMDCPYAREAIDSRQGAIIDKWRPELGPSPWEITLDLEPPYLVIPVLGNNDQLRAVIAVDFKGPLQYQREVMIRHYANEKTLTWLREGFGQEVLKAIESEGGSTPHAARLSESVYRARIGVGAAKSVDEALEALKGTLKDMVPGCRVSVRILKPEGLEEYDPLVWGERSPSVPIVYRLDNIKSISVHVIKTMRRSAIDDYNSYRAAATVKGLPEGYLPPNCKSSITFPLLIEGHPVGSMSVDSPQQINWKDEGYVGPLEKLAALVALVVRDIDLRESAAKANADKAALIAYALTTSNDALWRHWTVQRLAEMSNRIATAKRLLMKSKANRNVHSILQKLSDAVGLVSQERPDQNVDIECSFETVFAKLKQRFSDKRIVFETPHVKNAARLVRAPEFRVRHILEILINNGLNAIDATGTFVKVSFRVDGTFGVIEVINNGPDLPEHVKERLFKDPIPSEKGRGIGLLVARGAALQYKGDLSFERASNCTSFVLRLPFAETN